MIKIGLIMLKDKIYHLTEDAQSDLGDQIAKRTLKDERLKELKDERLKDERQTEEAVRDVLLPSLSKEANTAYFEMKKKYNLRPLTLFLSIDGVAKLLRRYALRTSEKVFEMDRSGNVYVEGTIRIPQSTIVREIVRMSRVTVHVAEELASWIPLAARSQPRLFLGAYVCSLTETGVTVIIKKREQETDLGLYWKKGPCKEDK